MGALPWTLHDPGLRGDELGKALTPELLKAPTMSESSPLPRSTTGTEKDQRLARHSSVDITSKQQEDVDHLTVAAAAATVLS